MVGEYMERHWRPTTGECFVLSGEGVESLAAIADAETAVADNTRSNGKNIRCLIMSPVNIQIVLTIDFGISSIVHASSSLNKQLVRWAKICKEKQ